MSSTQWSDARTNAFFLGLEMIAKEGTLAEFNEYISGYKGPITTPGGRAYQRILNLARTILRRTNQEELLTKTLSLLPEELISNEVKYASLVDVAVAAEKGILLQIIEASPEKTPLAIIRNYNFIPLSHERLLKEKHPEYYTSVDGTLALYAFMMTETFADYDVRDANDVYITFETSLEDAWRRFRCDCPGFKTSSDAYSTTKLEGPFVWPIRAGAFHPFVLSGFAF